jgi:hypothetical protein
MEFYFNARLGKGFRCPGNQLSLISDYIADVIGCWSGRKRDVLPTLQYGHLQIWVNPLSFGGRTGSPSTTTDDY